MVLVAVIWGVPGRAYGQGQTVHIADSVGDLNFRAISTPRSASGRFLLGSCTIRSGPTISFSPLDRGTRTEMESGTRAG